MYSFVDSESPITITRREFPTQVAISGVKLSIIIDERSDRDSVHVYVGALGCDYVPELAFTFLPPNGFRADLDFVEDLFTGFDNYAVSKAMKRMAEKVIDNYVFGFDVD